MFVGLLLDVKMKNSRVTLVFATVARPHCVQRLIRSARQIYPDIPIIVADQSFPACDLKDFYINNSVDAVFLSPDAGVSKARNAAVLRVKTEFFLLADDDFIFSPKTDLNIPISILDKDHEVDVIGGLLHDIYGDLNFKNAQVRRWERVFFEDATKGIFTALPIDMFFPIEKRTAGYSYYCCDAVMNWAVMRTNILVRGAKWDERYKCNGEHEDFYLNIKKNTNIRVAYCSDFFAFHHHPQDFGYKKQREKQEGWVKFGEKWGFQQYYNHPWGLQRFESGDKVYPQANSLEEFVARSQKSFAPRSFMAGYVNEYGDIEVVRSTADCVSVEAFVSGMGEMRLLEVKNENEKIENYSVSEFSLEDLIDVRNITIKVLKHYENFEIKIGEPINIHLEIFNSGKMIGVTSGKSRIAIGLRIKNSEGLSVPYSDNHLTPLVNNLDGLSYQYVSVVQDLPPDVYEVAIDLWVDGVEWLQRAAYTNLMVSSSPCVADAAG